MKSNYLIKTQKIKKEWELNLRMNFLPKKINNNLNQLNKKI